MNRKENSMLKQEQNRIMEEKIAAVNKIVGAEKRMTRSDKLLYYENHLNPENKFRSIIEFPSIQLLRWLNYMVNDKDSYDVFMNLFYNKHDIFDSITKFRGYLLNHEHKGQDVNASTIQQLITNNDYNHLKEIIQELFLEPFGDSIIEKLIRLINNNELSVVNLITWHREFLERRLGTLLTQYK
jgi:hypothetical protein